MRDKLQLKKYKAEVEHRIFILHYIIIKALIYHKMIFILHYYHYQGISLTI